MTNLSFRRLFAATSVASLVVIAIFAFYSKNESFSTRIRRVASSPSSFAPTEDALHCRISLFHMTHAASAEPTSTTKRSQLFMCSPVENGLTVGDAEYEISLDDTTRQLYFDKMTDELELVVSIQGAKIDEEKQQVVIPEGAAIVPHENHQVRRKLVSSTGTVEALGVLVRLSDASPTYSVSEYYQILFQNGVSLKNQYKSCSFGKMSVEPTRAGVIEVTVNLSSRTSRNALVNAATQEAVKYLNDNGYGSYGSLPDYADMTLLVIPSDEDWLAYANFGGCISVYNDRWGGYIASMMHETG